MKQIISFLLLVILSINICNAQENCTNGIDDDGDGLIDCVDPDCESCFANNPVYACNDLIYYYLPPTWQFNGSTPQDIFFSTQFPNADIHIQTINGSFSLDTSAQFGSPAIIQLPQGIVATPNFNTVETNRGLIITSNVPIQCVYRLLSNNNQDLMTLQADAAKGLAFRCGSQTKCVVPPSNVEEHHFIGVLATADSTIVTINSAVPLKGISSFPYSFTLNYGETYLMTDVDNSNQTMSGILVTANKPIVVNSGSNHTLQPFSGNRDAGFEQLVPVDVVESDYIAVRGNNQNDSMDYVIVVPIENNTDISVNGALVGNKNAGEYLTRSLPGNLGDAFYIHTSKRAYVFHVSGMSNNEVGMSLLPPIGSCSGSKYAEFLKIQGTNAVYALIPDAGLASLVFNGQPYTNYSTATPVASFPGWNVVVFNDADILGGNAINLAQSDIGFYMGQVTGNGGGGLCGFFSRFDSRVDVIDPITGYPINQYYFGSIAPCQSLTHCLELSSCGIMNGIDTIIAGQFTGGLSYNVGDTCFTYTAGNPSGYVVDNIICQVSNEFGLTGRICLKIVINPVDVDEDGLVDLNDIDDDNDGIPDVIESAGVGSTDFSSIGGDPSFDNDGDGFPNYIDTNYCVLNAAGVCNNLDTDGDGIIDQYDTDSDNDGCYDANESGANQIVNINGQLNPPYGNNGLANSVETIVDNGIINYSVASYLSNPILDYLNSIIDIACNDKPQANSDNIITSESNAINGNALLNDINTYANPITASLLDSTMHGELVFNPDGTYTYIPDTLYYGADTFSYIICDDGGPVLCDTGFVFITITLVNISPFALADSANTCEEQNITIDVLLNDSDTDGFLVAPFILSQPSNGVVTIVGNEILYAPSVNFYGYDNFCYVTKDNEGGTDTACVNVFVCSLQDAPIAISDTIILCGLNSFLINPILNDFDVDGDTISIISANSSTGLIADINNNGAVFGSFNQNIFDGSVDYIITDGYNNYDTATIYILRSTQINDSTIIAPSCASLANGSIELILSGGTTPYNFIWSNNATTQSLTNIAQGNYSVTTTDNVGCTDSFAYVLNAVCDSIAIPNAFSPNADGVNDYFVITGLEAYSNNSLSIFNRWGNIVFQQDGYNNDWNAASNNGFSKGDLSDGTYFYILKLNNSSDKSYSGFIDIRRK